jgi:hypothetical protein
MKKITALAALLPLMAWADSAPAYTQYGSSFNQSAFVPDISLIVDASYVNRSIKDNEQEAYSLYGTGYPEFAKFNANNGFNLNYAELALHSAVDQAFDLDGVIHISPEGIEIEEAYFTTRTLPGSFRLKGGKFKSDFGYLNSKHQHVWDFADAPLVYNAFLGGEGLNSPGLQLQWLAPTPWYMMLGVEAMQSTEEGAFANQSYDDVTTASEPSLTIAYLKNSFDIDDTTVLFGLSAASGASKNKEEAFDGTMNIYGADLLVKSYFNSYSYLKWQSELLYRDQDGTDTGNNSDLQTKSAGAYTQLVYAYDQNWRAGVRYDSMFKHEINGDNDASNRDRWSAMAEYNPSEFSRIRAQYNHNSAFDDADGNRKDIDTFMLEINLAMGAHGAHSF